jgi:hypothetical protein
MSSQKRGEGIAFPVGGFVLLALLFSGSCKWGVPQYTLNVVIESGVTGTPEAGKHAYKELSTVILSYTPVDPLETVEVLLNGTIRKEGSSSLIMFNDGYELKASLIDIRGSYKVTLAYTDTSVTAPDPFIITLTGADRLSGSFTDERGYHGTWTAQSNVLTLAYWDWEFYVLSNTVFKMGYSTGTFSGGGLLGAWGAVKQ